MEKQNQCPTASPSQLKQLYDIRHRNYEWQDFKYQLPRKYAHTPTSFIKSGSLFGTKKSYLDSLVQHKKTIPAPNHYKNISQQSRPQSGKMDRSKRLTFSQQISSSSKKNKIPGPGSYFKRPQSSLVMPTYFQHKQKYFIEKPHYLNEVQYLADNSPGVGLYNVNWNSHVGGPKIMKNKQPASKFNKENCKLLNVVQSCYGTFEWLKKQAKKKNNHFFGTTQRFFSPSRQSKLPAPNTYQFNHNWSAKTNSMNITSTANMKSIYYH